MAIIKITLKNIRFVFSNVLIVPAVIIFHIFQLVICRNVYENFVGTYDSGISQFVSLEIIGTKSFSDALSFYACATLAQLMLIMAVVTATLMAADFENNVLQRMLVAPISRASIIIGNFMGYFTVQMVMASAYIILIHLILEFSWGRNWLDITIITVILAFVSTSFSMFISCICKSMKIAASVSSFLVVIMAFASGGISAGMQFNIISKFTINRWAFDTYINTIEGQPLSHSAQNIAVLLLLGAAFLLLTVIIFIRSKIYE